jgi:type I restriction enzyme, S subunit
VILYTPKEIAKDSWLDSIPKSWELLRFKDMFNFVGTPRPDEELPILSLTRNGIVERDISGNEGQLAADYTEYPVIEPGTFVLNPMDLIAGWVAISKFQGRVSAAYFSFQFKESEQERFDARYFEFVLQAYYTQRILNPFGVGLGRSEYGGGRWTLNRQTLGTIPFPVPSKSEQMEIVKYLESELSQIHELILAKERLIALLEERRVVALKKLLLRGTNSSAELKSSECPWIAGESVPSHWSELRLSYILKLQSGDSITSEDIENDGTYPVFGGGAQRGFTERYTNDGTYVLIGRQGALCGNVRLVSGKFFASEHAVVVYPLDDIDTDWLLSMLEIMDLGQYSQSSAQPGISVDAIGKLKILLPPIEEQKEIGEMIRIETKKVSELVSNVRSAIQILNDRKQSLIANLVLGKALVN